VCTPPGGRIRDQHELDVFDGADRDGVPVGCSADGEAIGRDQAAWVLRTWHRKALRAGPAPAWATETEHEEVLWGPKSYGDPQGKDLVR
jgi:hypothetical protein